MLKTLIKYLGRESATPLVEVRVSHISNHYRITIFSLIRVPQWKYWRGKEKWCSRKENLIKPEAGNSFLRLPQH
jgi:hypothetical protein